MSEENLKKKQAVIDEIKGKFDKASSAVLIDYMGITVAEANAMRTKLREAEVDYKVYKNTLINRAIGGTDYEQLKDALSGPSALAFGFEDATAPARVLNGVIKDYKKMAFKAGVIEGVFYDAAGVAQIAEIPPRDVLLAKFLGSIQNPVSGFVRVLAAIADKDEGEAPDEKEAAAPTEEKPAEEAAPAEASETPNVKEETAPAGEKPAAEAASVEASETPDEKEAAAPAEEKPTEETAPAENGEAPEETADEPKAE